MHNYDYAEFLRIKRKESRRFKPSEEQIATAQSRIMGVFRKHHGWIDAVNEKALIRLLAKKVFNRNRELGDYKNDEFTMTLAAAVKQLIGEGIILLDEDTHSFGWAERLPARRDHQKYPNRGRRRAA